MKKSWLFFGIAALGTFTLAAMPVSWWEWAKLIGSASLQGMLALKALQSTPDEKQEPPPVSVFTRPLPIDPPTP